MIWIAHLLDGRKQTVIILLASIASSHFGTQREDFSMTSAE